MQSGVVSRRASIISQNSDNARDHVEAIRPDSESIHQHGVQHKHLLRHDLEPASMLWNAVPSEPIRVPHVATILDPL
jgi:hypothetical protein